MPEGFGVHVSVYLIIIRIGKASGADLGPISICLARQVARALTTCFLPPSGAPNFVTDDGCARAGADGVRGCD